MKIEFSTKQLRVLCATIVGLDLLFMLANWPPLVNSLLMPDPRSSLAPMLDMIRKQLDLKSEVDLATWYSSVILLMCGAVALLNSGVRFVEGKSRWVYRAGWWLIAALLIALSADEEAQIHESLAPMLNRLSRTNPQRWVREGAGDWVPLLTPFIAGSALLMIAFLGTVFWRHKKLLLLAMLGVACWVGAIYFESIESGAVGVQMSRDLEGFFEESCEIVGTTCLLFAFTSFFRKRQSLTESLRAGDDGETVTPQTQQV